MTLRQRHGLGPRQRAEDTDSGSFNGVRTELAVTLGGHLVQHHAGERDMGIMQGGAAREGRSRLSLSGDVENQHHRPSCEARDVGCGPAGEIERRRPVEEAHRALGDDEIRSARRLDLRDAR